MKKYLVALFLVALCSIASVYAIDNLTVTIPFGFVVGNRTLPAGDYVIQPLSLPGVMVIRELDANGAAATLAIPAHRRQIPEVITQWTPGPATGGVNNPMGNAPRKTATGEDCVVFNKYGDKYFISKIWAGLEGREFPVSRAERQLKTASTSIEREIVVLDAALR
jgi:hypothetical protein